MNAGPRHNASVGVFLSHVEEEAPLAGKLKVELERALPGATVFVSAVDIGLGEAWLKAVSDALDGARTVLVLCSRRSTSKPWVNFESGAGWLRHGKVIPLCHGGMTKDALPHPLSIFQALDLTSPDDCASLAQQLGVILDVEVSRAFDPESMARSVAEPPARGSEIGVALTHRQGEWQAGQRSVFALSTNPPPGVRGDWIFRPLNRAEDLMPAPLGSLSGLIFGSPWRERIDLDVIATIVDWVRAGGRLLILGFELGDRHHSANLGELTRHFGIHGETDIVGPPDFRGTKPYEVPVVFDVACGDPHPLTGGLEQIRLANVQTLRVEPGGVEWLRVGGNVVFRPKADTVQYHDGTLSQPFGSGFERNEEGRWLPVAVEAPAGLCGDGAVQAVGTWDLLGRGSAFDGDNLTLVDRLLDWLAGRERRPAVDEVDD